MSDDRKLGKRSTVVSRTEIPVWFGGWLFTIGYLKLTFWKAALALVIWPYYIGLAVR